MSFTKYASLEGAQVLEVRGSATRVRHASLGKLADFEQYRTSDGFLYARIRAISSRVNKNHDGWPSIELAGGQDVFDKHRSASGFTLAADANRDYGYSTFGGKPIFVDHHNSDPKRSRGAIVDSVLHVEDHKTSARDPYYSSAHVDPEHLPGTWVELLLEVDAKAFPKFAKAIVEGSRNPKKGIDGWSMGCDVEKSVCSICKHAASAPEDYCDHVKMKGAHFDTTDRKTGHKTSRKAYENCYGIKFFEISGVFDPADETALSLEHARTAHYEDDSDLAGGAHADGQWSCPTCHHGKYHEAQDFADGVPGDTTRQCSDCGAKDYASAHIPYPPSGPIGGDGYAYPEMAPEGGTLAPTNNPYVQFGDRHEGSTRTADNPLPQAEMSHAPEKVDTLRAEEICPVCGSSMDEDTCDVCGFQEPPKGFGNPDLTKAQDEGEDPPQENGEGPELPPPPADIQQGAPSLGDSAGANTPSNPTSLSHVTSMGWELPERTSARINKLERPLVATDKPQTNEPKEQILTDQLQPVTSRVRTAKDFIRAAAGAIRNEHMNHTADAASGAPAVAKPDVRTDVTGIGGVDDASNEAASKANAQVDVLGIGSTGEDSVGAEKEGVNVEQGDEHSKNIEAIPTMTWSGDKGDSLGQQSPVTSEVPQWVTDSKWSHWTVESLDDGDLISQEQQGGNTWGGDGGSAVKGNKPIAETFGDRVNLLEHLTTPANNSGPTKTWSGTDGNGVNKQQDPVTNESIALGESQMEGAPNWTASTHIFAAFKLADLEVELGMIPAEAKYARAAELEHETPTAIQASLRYAQRVRKVTRRTAGTQKLPVMARSTTVEKSAAVADEPASDDAFMFGGV